MAVVNLKKYISLVKIIARNVIESFKKNSSIEFTDSENYWENRYKKGKDSGVGSFGELAKFKADSINSFIKLHNINNIIEYGCGDGNQLKLLKIKNYVGFDISDTAVMMCKNKFKNKPTYKFKNIKEYANEVAELTLSLDVIYHLVEEDVYNDYLNLLFKSSQKYVIIYSSNNEKIIGGKHEKHREFTNWIKCNKNDWELVKIIPNPYKLDPDNFLNATNSDFYIYSKI